eukprot:CAMPEP_0117562164 /NCGR_PEP_ID=MMETSP0784-20121206/54810_1 /TAXON_ID=39447 /ORGANISM="" /LENGTH=284 /DNA_ID=CAMNT_0005359715 /DNA_START=89 /DNA_END=943 /DNA_ORIENTATION=+
MAVACDRRLVRALLLAAAFIVQLSLLVPQAGAAFSSLRGACVTHLRGASVVSPEFSRPRAVSENASPVGAPASLVVGSVAAAAALAAVALGRQIRGITKVARGSLLVNQAASPVDDEEAKSSRRAAVFLAVGGSTSLPAAALAEAPAEVDLPARIKSNPYELLSVAEPDDQKQDRKEFSMKRNYRGDTYQVVKHMKISASLDKGTPGMEQYQKRIKKEMDDWLALYRRQDAVVGRQSYYSLYSAVNALASHIVSYGPKLPFPNKRRQRFFQLINQTEKFLEKGK